MYSQFFNNTFLKISANCIQNLFPTLTLEETKLPFSECRLFRDITDDCQICHPEEESSFRFLNTNFELKGDDTDSRRVVA